MKHQITFILDTVNLILSIKSIKINEIEKNINRKVLEIESKKAFEANIIFRQ